MTSGWMVALDFGSANADPSNSPSSGKSAKFKVQAESAINAIA